LWLKGDGHGGFQAVPGQASGVKIYGEQRGCALADYDQDGRVDLVVTQNSGPTRLFHNRGAKPGLRIRLKGPPENPCGIGAQIRLMFGTQPGPLREIHAGAGYWSQDGPTQVLAVPQTPSAVWIRWPWGNAVSNAIPADAREITVDTQGKIESAQKR
jgi:enediyne biosynthesis protein E4